jgi:ribosomal protein S19
MRALWKGSFIPSYIYKDYYLNKEIDFYITKANSVIIDKFVGFTFFIYNGKKFIELLIDIHHVGFLLGQFIFNRRVGFIHKDNKNTKTFWKKKK